jgi:ABC-type transport system involved in multi-copper enzyme maturation permease subunit
MTLLPIVVRELRVASRRRGTYWVRTGAALALIIIGTWVFLGMRHDDANERSRVLFGILTGTAVLYALISGIRDTADCLSWEKREGTLGLLFLTDLKGYDIVLGKLVANSLNPFYSVAAVLPMLAVPLLMGGVTLDEFGRTALVALNTLFFSLTVGICISSFSRSLHKAAGGTFIVILAISGLFPAAGGLIALVTQATQPDLFYLMPSPGYTYYCAWDAPFKLYPDRFWISLGLVHGFAWQCLIVASFIAPRSWQDRPAGVRKLRWRERWKTWSHGNLAQRFAFRKRLLDVNAFFWLAARDRLKPLYVWTALAVLACGWLFGLHKLRHEWINSAVIFITAVVLNILMKTWFAAETGRQLAEDRRRGALELLLSTPLSVREILRGQLLALQRQFLGPVAVVLFIGFLLMWRGKQDVAEASDLESWYYIFWLGGMLVFLADLTALYYVGMWQALNARNPNRAASASVAQILILPGVGWLLVVLLVGLATVRGSEPPGGNFFLSLWFGLGLFNDILFGLWARHKLLTEFRNAAEQRFTPRPGLLRRLLSGS